MFQNPENLSSPRTPKHPLHSEIGESLATLARTVYAERETQIRSYLTQRKEGIDTLVATVVPLKLPSLFKFLEPRVKKRDTTCEFYSTADESWYHGVESELRRSFHRQNWGLLSWLKGETAPTDYAGDVISAYIGPAWGTPNGLEGCQIEVRLPGPNGKPTKTTCVTGVFGDGSKGIELDESGDLIRFKGHIIDGALPSMIDAALKEGFNAALEANGFQIARSKGGKSHVLFTDVSMLRAIEKEDKRRP